MVDRHIEPIQGEAVTHPVGRSSGGIEAVPVSRQRQPSPKGLPTGREDNEKKTGEHS